MSDEIAIKIFPVRQQQGGKRLRTDHIGSSVELLKSNPKAKLFAIYELADAVGRSAGVGADQVVGLNKGGTVDLGSGFSATLVTALHSSSFEGKQTGEAAGWVVHTPDGRHIYHTGDTDVFSDMRVIGDLHHIDTVLACIGDHFTMGPEGCAFALEKMLPNVKVVVPMHWGTFPVLSGTPARLIELLKEKRHGATVRQMIPGKPETL